MSTKHILSRSVATLLALTPLVTHAAQQSITAAGNPTLNAGNVAWGTDANWSGPNGALKPTATDNAAITYAGTTAAGVDIRGSGFPTHATTIQDLSFIGTGSGAVTLENNSTSQPMVLTLNGGRGAGIPLIQSGGYAVTIAGNGPGTAQTLVLLLAASGEINAGTGGLTITAAINETGGARSINKTGANRLTLSGANNYTGGTTVTAGILEVVNNSALGTGAAVLNGGTLEINVAAATLTASSITVNAGGQIATRGAVTLNNALTLNGGTLATRSNDSGVYAGAINVTADSFAVLRSYSTPASDLSITISGLLSGSSALTINGNASNATSARALILTNPANSYSGTINVSAAQTLRNAPATTGRTIGSGTVNLVGGTLQLRDDGTGSGGTLAYGNNVVVQSATSTVDVDHVAANTGNVFSLGNLSIGAQTLNISGANGYGVRFGATTLSGNATFNATTAPATLGGVVSGGFSLTKTGAATVTLLGANSYSGNTNVDGGTLALAGSIASSPRIDVKAGATFDVSGVAGGFTLGGTQTLAGAGTVAGSLKAAAAAHIEAGNTAGAGTLTLSSLTFGTNPGDAATILLKPAATALAVNVTGVSGLVANGGANSVTLNIAGATPAIAQYVLVDYNGVIGGTGFGAFTIGSLPSPRVLANLVNNAANTSIDLNVTAIDFPIWKGALSTEWSAATLGAPKNWVLNSNNASTTDFLVNDSVIFNDLATSATPTVDVSVADVAPSSVTFSNVTKNYTLTGTKLITGAGALTKTGAGTLTINNTNSFTGGVSLSGGTVSVAAVANSGANSPLGAGSTIAFDGGTLEFTGGNGTTDRSVVLNAGGGTVINAAALTLSGVITGAGTLTKTAAGTLTLTGTSAFTGAARVNGGTVSVATVTNSGVSGPLGAGTEIAFDGGTLRFTGAAGSTDRAITVNAGGATVNADVALTLAGVISGGGAFTKTGAGTLTLSGAAANTYAGVTTVSAGVLFGSKTDGINAIPGNLVLSAGGGFRLVNSNQLADTASVTINGGDFGDPATIAAPVQAGPIDTVANVTVNSGNFLSNRNVTGITVANLLKVTGGLALVQRGGVINAGAVEFSGGTLNLDGGSTTTANESQLKIGAGGLTLTGSTINLNAGPSAVAANSVGSVVTLNGDVTSSGTSGLARLNTGVSNASLNLLGGVRTFNVTGALTIGSAAGPIPISNGGIIKTGGGALTLNGPQSYAVLTTNAGITTVNGVLNFATITNSAGTLNLNANATNSSVDVSGTTNFGSAQTLSGLSVNTTGLATLLAYSGGPANIRPLDTTALTLTGGAKLNLTNNAMIVRSSTLAAVNAKLVSGYNAASGYWDGPGINSSLAANDLNGLTGIGVIDNAEYGYTNFAGVTGLVGTEILLKYTWVGDADLNGVVNGDDFTQFAFGFNGGTAKWLNGDFDYNGVVNGDDFTLFAAGFNGQTGQLRPDEAAAVSTQISHFARVIPDDGPGAGGAIPEPGTLAALIGGSGVLVGLGRFRRRW